MYTSCGGTRNRKFPTRQPGAGLYINVGKAEAGVAALAADTDGWDCFITPPQFRRITNGNMTLRSEHQCIAIYLSKFGSWWFFAGAITSRIVAERCQLCCCAFPPFRKRNSSFPFVNAFRTWRISVSDASTLNPVTSSDVASVITCWEQEHDVERVN